MILTAPLVLKRAPQAETGSFSGLASTWSVDRQGERIARGAFAASIRALDAGTQRIAVLANHNPLHHIGKIDSARETDSGLAVEGTIVLGHHVADRVHGLLLHQAAGLSVGFSARPEDTYRDEEGIKTYRQVDLMEVSVVGLPANQQAIVHSAKNYDLAASQLEKRLREGTLPILPRELAASFARACTQELDAMGFDADSVDELLDALPPPQLRAHSNVDFAGVQRALDQWLVITKRF